MKLIAFGPVPSRRLGRSLGVNNIPPKICSYSCVYCQVGRTKNMQNIRRIFYTPDEIVQDVEKKIREAKQKGELIDYLTFVPDGEPTLDINLGSEIELLKTLGIKIAVITNSSLIWRDDVQIELAGADWVSFKIDAVSQDIWHKVNRPHGALRLNKILQGIKEFAQSFKGELVTETMLLQGLNDDMAEIEKVSDFIAQIKPDNSYIAIPTRPPAEKYVVPPTEKAINLAYQVFREKSIPTEYLIGYEGNAFAFTGNVEDDLLSITSVHPMREDGVEEFLTKANADWGVIKHLKRKNKLVEVKYNDKKFYLRKFK
jgi:wyosine [tRNA(Phe)-imidazoG37] synthetase (radical SAM superfamily)